MKLNRFSDNPIQSPAAFVATSVILKFTWYDKLGPGQMYLEDHPNPFAKT